MPLTGVQTRARRWLCSNYGLKSSQVTQEGTAFTTSAGTFIPKMVVSSKTGDNKVAQLFPDDIERLVDDPDHTSVLFVPQYDGEVMRMPGRAIRENPDQYNGVSLLHRVSTDLRTGTNGEILLHVSRRGLTSNSWRVNHVPMDSMLVYRDYSGHLSISTIFNGKPDFWLCLKPENYGLA